MRVFFRVFAGITFSFLSALLLWLAFPPQNLGLLIWFSFVPMLIAQYRVLPEKISSLAPALAISGWLGAMLIPAFGGKSLVMVIFPLGVFTLVLFTDRKKRAFHQDSAFRWFVLEGTISWVGLEMVRSFIPAIGTWAFVGYALWDQPWLLQPLSVFGIYGLDLLIMISNYTLALMGLLVGTHSRWALKQMSRRWLFSLGLLLAGWVALSLWMYTGREQPTQTVRVAVIQPNLPRAAHRDTDTGPDERLAILVDLTHQAGAQAAALIVWPEMALGFDPQKKHTQTLKQLAAEENAYLVIGYVFEDQAGFWNQALLISPGGNFLGVTSKTHPMLVSGEPRSQGSGDNPVLDTSIGRLGMMICFDASFTDVARRLASQGAQIIATPSLLGPSIAGLTQVMPVFRAIENRAAVLMADVAYNSAIIDPYGRIVEATLTPEGQQSVLVADVPLATGNSFYARFGDYLGFVSLIGWVLLMVFNISASRDSTA